MNIPFLTNRGMEKRFTTLIEDFIRIKNWPVRHQSKQSDVEKIASMNKTLENGLDVKTADEERLIYLVSLYGVEYKEPEEKLCKDNCVADDETGICTRRLWCGGSDNAWLKKAKERQQKMEKQVHLAKKRMEMYAKTREELRKFHEESNDSVASEKDDTGSEIKDDDRDESYTPGKTSYRISKVIRNDEKHRMTTRAKDHSPPYEFGSPICSATLGSPICSATLGSPICSATLGSPICSATLGSPICSATLGSPISSATHILDILLPIVHYQKRLLRYIRR